jgi:hypothetical protein
MVFFLDTVSKSWDNRDVGTYFNTYYANNSVVETGNRIVVFGVPYRAFYVNDTWRGRITVDIHGPIGSKGCIEISTVDSNGKSIKKDFKCNLTVKGKKHSFKEIEETKKLNEFMDRPEINPYPSEDKAVRRS